MTVIPQTRYEVLPMAEYSAVITSANLTEGNFGPQVEFLFTVDGGDHDGANLKHWTSAKFSPKSNLYRLTRAAFGKDIPETYDLDLDDLLGRRLNLMVTIKVKAEDASEFNKVDDLRPWRQLDEHGRPVATQQPLTNTQKAQSQIGTEEDYPF